MKKKELLLKILILFAVVLTFFIYWLYRSFNADMTPPVLTVAEGIPEVSVMDGQDVLLQGVTAKDNHDGDVTDSVIIESIYGITGDNLVTVTYAAFDGAGNVSKTQRQIRYVDYEPIRFTLDAALIFSSNSTDKVTDFLGAEHLLDGDLSRKIRSTLVSDTGSLSQVGTHQVMVQVTNSLGDSAELILPVEVYAAGSYNAELTLKEYMVYLNEEDTFNAKSYLSEYAYAGKRIELGSSVPSDVKVTIDESVNTREPGVYPVYYTVTCQQGDMVFVARSCLIVVVTE